ncbi:MAG: hypothetical protein K5790_01610 [Nitrosopumilus sp.]|uniref:hypothetical protein n=1 Tax=Nitrosopumilus sp. TaxID=2024843 RepID=UPI00247DF3AF|nr:hypothetical protein [Nitrosopumilus sp.]MCV0391970.1 hypothetical protein [Nitrosopumilus sp.]
MKIRGTQYPTIVSSKPTSQGLSCGYIGDVKTYQEDKITRIINKILYLVLIF